MPRPLRLESPGAIYHVMNRGDRLAPYLSRLRPQRAEAPPEVAWNL